MTMTVMKRLVIKNFLKVHLRMKRRKSRKRARVRNQKLLKKCSLSRKLRKKNTISRKMS